VPIASDTVDPRLPTSLITHFVCGKAAAINSATCYVVAIVGSL
jgi:hypothetical protein